MLCTSYTKFLLIANAVPCDRFSSDQLGLIYKAFNPLTKIL